MRLLVLTFVLCAAVAGPDEAQITDLDRERLVAHLEMTASWLIDEVSDLSPVQLAFRRAPDTWSILEVLEHLVIVGPIYWDDLQRSVKGETGEARVSTDDLPALAKDAATQWTGTFNPRPFDEAARQWRDRMLAVLDTSWEISSLRGEVSSLRGRISSIRGQESSLRGEISSLGGEVSSMRAPKTSPAAQGRRPAPGCS